MSSIEERLAAIEKKLDLILSNTDILDITQKWQRFESMDGKFLGFERHYRNRGSFHYQKLIERYGEASTTDTWSNRDMYLFNLVPSHLEDKAREVMIDCLAAGDIKGLPVNLKVYDYNGTTVWGADLEVTEDSST